jgi:hypothetical protein
MRILINLVLGVLVFSNVNAQTKSSKCFYLGYDSGSKVYVFVGVDGEYYEFAEVEAKVLNKFDLRSNSLEGKAFNVSYTSKELQDEDGYDYEELILVDLQEIDLKREEPDDEDDEEDE